MKKITLLSLTAIAVMLLSVSCKKKCTISEVDTFGGDIVWTDSNADNIIDVDEVPIIYPKSGFLTDGMDGDYHLWDASVWGESFDVSFNGGLTRAAVDFSQYNLLCYPLSISCDVAVSRKVTFDHANSTATYTIGVTSCDNGCDELRVIENYILVPAFASNYTILFDVP